MRFIFNFEIKLECSQILTEKLSLKKLRSNVILIFDDIPKA